MLDKNRILNGNSTYMCITIFTVTVVRLIWNFLYGFRWPSPYVLTNTVFTYESGFIPRGFIASVFKLFLGNHIYSYKFLYILIIGTTIIIYLFFMYMSYYFAIKQKNLIGACLVLWFSLSIYSAYLVHEAGYFEQYGYALLFVFILSSLHIKKTPYLLAFGAGIGFISLLISETNAFLTYTVLLAICFMKIFEPLELGPNIGLGGVKYNLFLLGGFNLPNLIYCLYIGVVGANAERVAEQIRIIYSRPIKFELLKEIYGYFTNRLPKDYIGKVEFKVWNWQLMSYLLLIIFTVSIVLLFSSQILRVRNYIMASIVIMVCIYLLNFIAWDAERFKFGVAMAITLFSIWVCLTMDNKKIIVNKDIVYTLVIGSIIMIVIMDYRLGLFDAAVYNNSWEQFKETLQSTWRINY